MILDAPRVGDGANGAAPLEPQLCALLCIGDGDARLVGLIRDRLGTCGDVVAIASVAELREVLAQSIVPTVVAVDADSGLSALDTFTAARRVRLLGARVWFGRSVAPVMPKSPPPTLRDVEVWQTVHGNRLEDLADDLASIIRRHTTNCRTRIDAGRACAHEFGLGSRGTELAVLCMLGLSTEAVATRLGMTSETELDSFVTKSVGRHIGSATHVDVVSRLLTYGYEWMSQNQGATPSA